MRAQRTAAPAAVGVAVLAALAVVAVRNPEEPGHYPTCPFYAATDLYCPGCGSLRAVHALAHGDLGTAIDRNVLAVAVLPFFAVLWVVWMRRGLTGRPAGSWMAPVSWLYAFLGVVAAFWIFRNVPAGSWLAP
ncbi:MAG: DUF2752 domain-containing protein [Sporichthyaceae bacterium]